jgi:hypothetical protein
MQGLPMTVYRLVFRWLDLQRRVKVARDQVTTAIDGSMVGHLNDPRTCGGLRRVKQRRLTKDEEKDLLHQVVCLRLVPQDSESDTAHNVSVTAKQGHKGFPCSLPDLFH